MAHAIISPLSGALACHFSLTNTHTFPQPDVYRYHKRHSLLKLSATRKGFRLWKNSDILTLQVEFFYQAFNK